MNEAVLVEARVGRDGSLRPRAFLWAGQTFTIASIGRQWTDGGDTHVLVKAAGAGPFELAFSPKTSAWRLVRTPADFGPRAHV